MPRTPRSGTPRPRHRLVGVVLRAGAAAALALAPGRADASIRPPSLPVASGPSVTLTYSVEARGPVRSDLGTFRAIAAATLHDPRGWSLGGSIEFVEVPNAGDLRLVLATAEEVAAADPVCDATWSCRVGDDVLVNEERWLGGSDAYPLTITNYRSYVLNHEVGHWLGLDHEECVTGPAPVMAQQSKGVGDCRPTVWPLDHERRAVAFRHGTEIGQFPATHPGLDRALRTLSSLITSRW